MNLKTDEYHHIELKLNRRFLLHGLMTYVVVFYSKHGCTLCVRMFQVRLRYKTEQNSTSIDLSVRCRRANTNE